MPIAVLALIAVAWLVPVAIVVALCVSAAEGDRALRASSVPPRRRGSRFESRALFGAR